MGCPGKLANLLEFAMMWPMNKNLPPQGHRHVETEDGSVTLFSEAFGEACHSTSGAKTETITHYIQGCELPKRLDLFSPFHILEVGFGLGLGLLTTMEFLGPQHQVRFISLELDRHLLEWFVKSHPEFSFSWEGHLLKGQHNNVEVVILQGDARETLPAFLTGTQMKFHAIYQDAFSPRRNPVLWTREWFSLLKIASDPEVILSTYSASSSIRKSLLEAGWGLQKGAAFGPKKASTRAKLNSPSDPEILESLNRSPVPALSDLNLGAFLSKMKP